MMKLASLPVLLPLGWWLGGFWGVLIGLVAAEVVRYVMNAYALHRLGAPVFSMDFALSTAIAITAGGVIACEWAGLFSEAKWWRLLEEVGVGATLWLLVYFAAEAAGLVSHSRNLIAGSTSGSTEAEDLNSLAPVGGR
jgi:hypothetical protein